MNPIELMVRRIGEITENHFDFVSDGYDINVEVHDNYLSEASIIKGTIHDASFLEGDSLLLSNQGVFKSKPYAISLETLNSFVIELFRSNIILNNDFGNNFNGEDIGRDYCDHIVDSANRYLADFGGKFFPNMVCENFSYGNICLPFNLGDDPVGQRENISIILRAILNYFLYVDINTKSDEEFLNFIHMQVFIVIGYCFDSSMIIEGLEEELANAGIDETEFLGGVFEYSDDGRQYSNPLDIVTETSIKLYGDSINSLRLHIKNVVDELKSYLGENLYVSRVNLDYSIFGEMHNADGSYNLKDHIQADTVALVHQLDVKKYAISLYKKDVSYLNDIMLLRYISHHNLKPTYDTPNPSVKADTPLLAFIDSFIVEQQTGQIVSYTIEDTENPDKVLLNIYHL